MVHRRKRNSFHLGSGKPFLENVVLGGNDPMKEQRLAFYNQYLLPPGGKSVAENIYQEIVDSIWG